MDGGLSSRFIGGSGLFFSRLSNLFFKFYPHWETDLSAGTGRLVAREEQNNCPYHPAIHLLTLHLLWKANFGYALAAFSSLE